MVAVGSNRTIADGREAMVGAVNGEEEEKEKMMRDLLNRAPRGITVMPLVGADLCRP
jgi:hypothetical protein